CCRIRSGTDLPDSELLPGLEYRVSDFVAVFPRPKDLPSGLSNHSMSQGANVLSGDFERVHVEEPDVRYRFASEDLHDLYGVGTLDLIAENLTPALVHGGSFITFHGN